MKKVLTAIALAGLTGAAFAQAPVPAETAPTAPPEQASFQKLDTNRDGALSKIEASSDRMLQSNFDAADKNADGKLDAAEYRAAIAK
ncbi:MAG TPA: hypothetical protein VGO41_12130 [Steroidobacteraceae bacterium]|nr:hypothetical protein [Steroidobacteraceae bacterium]